jgi:hypothetical protein
MWFFVIRSAHPAPVVGLQGHPPSKKRHDQRPSLQFLSTAAFYGLSPERAQQAVTAVVRAVDGCRDGAKRTDIARADIEMTAIAFSAHAAYRAP